MAINPLIALGTQPVSTQQGINIFNQEKERQRLQGATQASNEALGAQTEGQQIKNLDARNQARLKSLVTGAARLAPVLERGDTDAAMRILQQRRDRLQEQGIDTSDTDEAIQMAEQGNIQGLTQSVTDALNVGKQMGMLGASTKNFQALTPQTVRMQDEQGNPINRVVVPIVDKRTGNVVRRELGQSAQLTPSEQLQQEIQELEAKAQAEARTPQGQASLEQQRSQAAKAEAEAQETETRQRKAENVRKQALEVANRLLSKERSGALDRAVGPIQGRIPSFTEGAVDVENDIELLKNLLTTENLDLMTGVLSESDIKMLKSLSAGGLDLNSSEARIRGALRRIRDALSEQLGAQTSGADLSPAEIQELETLRQQQAR